MSGAKKPNQEALIQRTVDGLLNGATPDQVREIIGRKDKVDLSDAKLSSLLAQATQRFVDASSIDRDAELGKSLLRLNNLYARAILKRNFGICLAVQKEINSLLKLKPREDPPQDASDPSRLKDIRFEVPCN
jgi:hypothetical protein